MMTPEEVIMRDRAIRRARVQMIGSGVKPDVVLHESVWAGSVGTSGCSHLDTLLYAMRLQGAGASHGLVEQAHQLYRKTIGVRNAVETQQAYILVRLAQYAPTATPVHGPHPCVVELQKIIEESVSMIAFGTINMTASTMKRRAIVAISGSRKMTSNKHVQRARQTPTGASETLLESWCIEGDLFFNEMKRLPCRIASLLQGECYKGGADEHAKVYGEDRGIPVVGYPPEQNKGWAMTKRNREMERDAQVACAFWDGKVEKSGTLNFMDGVFDDSDWVVWKRWPNYRGKIECVFYAVRLSWLIGGLS
jgi:hypothetical protein